MIHVHPGGIVWATSFPDTILITDETGRDAVLLDMGTRTTS